MIRLIETVRRLLGPQRYTRPSNRVYIVRRRDGKVWKGPYRDGWTTKPKEWYLFGSERFAQAAMDNHDLKEQIVRIL